MLNGVPRENIEGPPRDFHSYVLDQFLCSRPVHALLPILRMRGALGKKLLAPIQKGHFALYFIFFRGTGIKIVIN